MKQFLKENLKRVLAFVVVVALLVTMIPYAALASNSTDMTITGVDHTAFSDHLRVWFTTSTTLPEGDYTGFSVEINGNAYEGTPTVVNDGGMLLFVLWDYQEASPASGSAITIKAGTGTGANGNIRITEDYTVEYKDGAWVEKANTPATTDMEITGVGQTQYHQDGHWRVWLTTSEVLPEGEFGGLTLQVDGNAYAGMPTVVNDGGMLLLVLWDYTNQTPANGSEIVLKAGTGTNANKNINITEDFTLVYNEATTSWSDKDASTPTNTDMTITGIGQTQYHQDGHWRIWVNVSDTLPGAEYAGLTLEVNGQTYTGIPTIINEGGMLLYVLWDYTDQVPVDGSTITFKAGTGTNPSGNVNITEDYTITYKNGVWQEKTNAPTATDMTIVGVGQTQFTDHLRVWLNTSATLPEGEYTGLTLDINESAYAGTPTVLNDGGMLLLVLWDYQEAAPADGSKITLKAGMGTNSNGNINITKDFTIVYNATTKLWYGENERLPVYEDLKFTDYIASPTDWSDKDNRWNFYFTPSKTLPGTPDSTTFSGLKVSVQVGDKAAQIFDIAPLLNVSYQNSAMFCIWPSELPKSALEQGVKFTVLAGYAGSNDGSNGVHLTDDFTLYANKFGWSTSGFQKEVVPSETDVKLAIDRTSAYGGNQNGIYLTTGDHFPVDTTWSTRIKALGYDKNSGVFLNGEKIDAQLIRFEQGKVYVALADGGYIAKDRDVLTVKGTFVLSTYGVSYKEVSFHFNGKIWNETYVEAAPETYKKFNVESVNAVTNYNEQNKRWNVYLNVDTMLPGEIDMTNFTSLTLQIGTETFETVVAHSYQHTLFVPIYEEYLPANCKDGTKIVLKAGKALAADMSTGIELTKDFTFYSYKGSMTQTEPTTNTDWQDATITGLLRTGSFHKEAKVWQVYIKLQQELKTEIGTVYLQMPIEINGKTYLLNATQEGSQYLYVSIPESMLAGNAKTATISVKAGSKITANAGYNGIEITDDWTAYLFNGTISDTQFTEVQQIETGITGLHNVTPDKTMAHVYLRLNKEFPGSAWYEYFDDFVYYYNGKEIASYVCKCESSNNKLMYFPIEYAKVGEPQEGDVIQILHGTLITCGGYEVTLMDGIKMIYMDGVWSEYIETDVEKPADVGSLWSIARFDKGYIPTTTDGSVLFSGEDKYNAITSMEAMKDYTVSFKTKKAYDDEIATGFKVILRGNPISEEEPMTTTFLYGYVVTFSAMEIADPENPEETIWSGYLELWKNGENEALVDQYRITYVHDKTDHPFFEYDKEYDYEFSIYNVSETCACIEVKVNGETVLRYYDKASSDPLDPVVNEGTFGIYGTGPNYIGDDIVELNEVISEKDECVTGEEVRVAATYPAVIEGAEFTVDSKNAVVTDGVFKAEKAGTYTISCNYNGKELEAKTITVTKAEATNANGEIPIVPIVSTVALLLVVGVIVVLFVSKKHRTLE